MRKRKRRRVNGKLGLLYISMIVSLGTMGVGYAAWNNSLNVELSLKTGFIKPAFVIDSNLITSDGNLNFELSDDEQTLIIGGDIYHGFNEDIEIRIKDEGSIPVELSKIDKDIRDVSNLVDNKRQYRALSRYDDEYIETFDLNIKPKEPTDTDEVGEDYMDNSLSSYENLSGLEWDIKILEEEIRKYDKEYNYEFEYKLTFDQGI